MITSVHSYGSFLPLVEVDNIFPPVCVNERFVYQNPEAPMTRLAALKDAERAASLYQSCRFHIPANFDAGFEKISNVVGQDVTIWNARRLRQDLEEKLSGNSRIIKRSALSWVKRQLGAFIP